VTVTSFPEGETEMFEGAVHPKRAELGKRQLPFSRSLLIERSDFDETAPSNYFRFKGVGSKVRIGSGFGLYKIFVYSKSCVYESIVLSFLSPTCTAHTVATIARVLGNTSPPLELPRVCHTPYNIGNAIIV